jgi:protease-4
MKNKGWLIGIVLVVLVVLFMCFGCTAIFLTSMSGDSYKIGPADSVAVIRVEGIIASSSDSGLLSGATVNPESIISQIRQANKDSRVASILIRVDSPGGSAAASQEIYKEVTRSKKPIVISIADVGASGAYYISSGAKKIMASPASMVGSIGVIMSVPNLEELYKKLGISYVTIKQGKYKDIGSSDRPMTDEEKQMLTKETEIIYEQFINDVAKGRNMPVDKVREMATGMAWAGSEAKDMGLVDELGNYQDAITLAGKLGKIKGEPRVVGYGKTTLWDVVAQSLEESGTREMQRIFSLFMRQNLPAETTIPK